MYDVTIPWSLLRAIAWKRKFDEYCGYVFPYLFNDILLKKNFIFFIFFNKSEMPVILIANKIDLLEQPLDETAMNDLVKQHGFLRWYFRLFPLFSVFSLFSLFRFSLFRFSLFRISLFVKH